MAKSAAKRHAQAGSSSEETRPSTRWFVPGLAVLAGAALRLWSWHLQPWVTVDGTEYIRLAKGLAAGTWLPSIFPPGYPALIALAHWVVPDGVAAAALVSFFAGSLLPWPVWILARRAVGSRWAMLPTFVVAMHPVLALYSALSMSESAYFLAVHAGLALAVTRRAWPAGLAMGSAFAIRPEALLPAGVLWLRSAGQALRGIGSWRHAAFTVLGFLVFAVPCWLSFHATAGVWTLSPKLSAFRAPAPSWIAEEARLKPDAAAAETDGLEPLGRTIGVALQHYPSNALGHGRSLLDLWPLPLLLLALIGLWFRRGIEAVPLLHGLALPLLGLSAQPRFVLGMVPALAILATVPLARAASRRARGGLALLWLAGLILCGVQRGPELALPIEGYMQAQKEAGEWLATVARPDEPVMDRKPQLAFYAGLPYRVMPEAPYDSLLAFAIRSEVRYLVLDEGVIRIFRPQLRPLLYDATFREQEPRLEAIYAGGHFKGFRVVIFRVLRPAEAKTGKPPHNAVRWVTPGGVPPDR